VRILWNASDGTARWADSCNWLAFIYTNHVVRPASHGTRIGPLAGQDQYGEHRRALARFERHLREPQSLCQAGVMARLEVKVYKMGVQSSGWSTFVRDLRKGSPRVRCA
jgi:hypothetical protein